MTWPIALAVMIGLILMLMGVGVPVAFAFFATNIVCLYLFMGGPVGVAQMVTNFGDAVSMYALTPMPLFLIMGSLFFRSGLGDGVFKAIDMCIGNLRARLAYLVVLAGAVFASLSGSSLANTGMMGSAMVPEMLRRGYKPHMAFGPVLGAGGLAVIIPPSSLAVLLGSLAQIDVGALLIAGFLPGLLLTAMYIALIAVQAGIDHDAAPQYDAPTATLREKVSAILANVVPMSVIVFLVVGTIILGFASPTESLLWPRYSMSPSFMVSEPVMAFMVVVLPAPLEPISVTSSPSCTSKSTPLTAWMPPYATLRPVTFSSVFLIALLPPRRLSGPRRR